MILRRIFSLLIVLLLAAAPAAATVNSSTNKTIALGNGSATSFAFSFIGVAAQYITVIYTDASGNQTTLTAGSGATQYQITLNPAVPGAIWGLGGTVTYNPNSTPIASGTTLTIYRTLPLTQAINLQNLSSIAVLGKGAETGLDTGVMQGQQINEQIARAIVANIANSTPPLPLPPAAQLANQGLCGDGTGLNIVGCALPSSGVISSAMQPVVNAATLAAGRLAFGLGSMAQENINGGTCGGASIQDDGSAGGANGVGYARVVYATTSDSTNQSVTCAFHNTERIATGPITYTLPRASTTLFNGWGFRIDAFTGTITIAPNANDNFTGVAAGTSVAIAPGASCWISTNAASSATWLLDCSNGQPSLSASASGNALTLTLSSPSLAFRDTTLANGGPLAAIPAAGLSITVPTGATLGTSNSVPFRGWIFAAYNSGTPILGVATCSVATSTTVQIAPCAAWETIRKSGTAITSGSTASGTLYTSASTSNDAVRIIGYFEYAAGLATAGTYNIVPTTLQLCSPPFVCKRPGDTIQSTAKTSASGDLSLAVTPSSTPNLIRITTTLGMSVASNTIETTLLKRGSTTILTQQSGTGSAATTIVTVLNAALIDNPATTSSTTYTTSTSSGTPGVGSILLDEIMGALESPANDNGIVSAAG